MHIKVLNFVSVEDLEQNISILVRFDILFQDSHYIDRIIYLYRKIIFQILKMSIQV